MGRFCKAFYFHVSFICVANSAARGDLRIDLSEVE